MRTPRSHFIVSAPLLLALLALPGCGGNVDGGSSGSGGGGSGGTGPGCEFGGKTYSPGESFPAGDGCNSCTCSPNGDVGCTLAFCAPVCEYGGQQYGAGQSFPDLDGCNTCTCEPNGLVACTDMACPTGCAFGGKVYQPGESFPAGDGCNTCMCQADGKVACTAAYCEPVCVYAGKEYGIGQTFPALDGCNKCTCTDQGVSCTELACACDPSKEWWRQYVSKDPKQCAVIDYACPPNTTGFGNACGCGCEQDASCPQWFDCMPPSPCDPKAIKEKCPYSGIAY